MKRKRTKKKVTTQKEAETYNKLDSPAPTLTFELDTAQGILTSLKQILQSTANGEVNPRQAGAMNGTLANVIRMRSDVIQIEKLREEIEELKQRLGVTSRTELIEAIRRLSPEAASSR